LTLEAHNAGANESKARPAQSARRGKETKEP
jgi:hypothetical protein